MAQQQRLQQRTGGAPAALGDDNALGFFLKRLRTSPAPGDSSNSSNRSNSNQTAAGAARRRKHQEDDDEQGAAVQTTKPIAVAAVSAVSGYYCVKSILKVGAAVGLGCVWTRSNAAVCTLLLDCSCTRSSHFGSWRFFVTLIIPHHTFWQLLPPSHSHLTHNHQRTPKLWQGYQQLRRRNLRHLIRTVGPALDAMHATWWLDFGSLLGAHRDKDVIIHDNDADVSLGVFVWGGCVGFGLIGFDWSWSVNLGSLAPRLRPAVVFAIVLLLSNRLHHPTNQPNQPDPTRSWCSTPTGTPSWRRCAPRCPGSACSSWRPLRTAPSAGSGCCMASG